VIRVYESAVRAWVEPIRAKRMGRPKKRVPWRSAPFGKRVLVVDTETTTDYLQRLLFGVFRLYEDGQLATEGMFYGDSISETDRGLIDSYARERQLPVLSRMDFSKTVFFPQVYVLGTLCVGFNLPFDLSRIAQMGNAGHGHNRRKFRLTLTDWHTNPAIYIEPVSGRAAFIGFAYKKAMADWEKPFFKGRFLDLSTLAGALTGRRFTLARAAIVFRTEHRKTKTADLGTTTVESLNYCRNDVLVTAELYERLLDEYLRYPFASLENERTMPPDAVPITRIYSTASVAKATLRMMGFTPLFDGGIQ
jgi:hypothetical protein